MSASFPYFRMRRGRSSPWMRAMLAEHRLHPSDLIWPLFVTEGEDCEEPIGSPARRHRAGRVDRIGARAREAPRARHPVHRACSRTRRAGCARDDAREALNPDNLICRAIKRDQGRRARDRRAHRRRARSLYRATAMTGWSTTPATSSTTTPWRCWSIRRWSRPRPAPTSSRPSDMMDGRVGAIRAALEAAGHANVADHGLCRQICVGLLRPVPRRGRLARPAEGRQEAATRWTRPMPRRRCARSRSTSPRAPTP